MARLPGETPLATVLSLTHDGQGVANVAGRRTLIAGALPGEIVIFRYLRRHRQGDEGVAIEIVESSPDRVEPRCPYTERCGGCRLQHLAHDAQLRHHQAYLASCLDPGPHRWLAPLTRPPWGYRRKARLGVKYVTKRDVLLVGFRERASPYVTEIDHCPVLHPSIGERILVLRQVLSQLSIRDKIPQVEIAAGDVQTRLVIRNMAEPNGEDIDHLRGFARDHGLTVALQPGGLDTIAPLEPADPPPLRYELPDYRVAITFRPTDFTQVNGDINRAMVNQALALLEPQTGGAVLDLYCGLGNFTLPLARRGGVVTGIEGEAGLVARARDNAQANGLTAEFISQDLSRGLPADLPGTFPLALLDPPRSGALEVLTGLVAKGVQRLVYVSCNPATLGRDVAALKHHGYQLCAAGIVDMFPHTGHVESMALLERS